MTATEQTLIGNDNSPTRVITDTLMDHYHQDCEFGNCACPRRDQYEDVAKEILEQLGEHFHIVPRADFSVNPHVRPYLRDGLIYRYASDRETPEQAEQYAAKLLALAEQARADREQVTR